MNEEEFDKKWNSRYKEHVSSGHDVPSPETRERLATLETNLDNFMDILKQSIQDNKEAHESLVGMIKGIENKLDGALEKKADKTEVDRIRGIIQWVSYTIIGGVIVALLALVIK